ncbi:MAG: hypothetical protein KOO60_11470 [Gemmatimonadales bacterium]|nr:hypothetical protein [Gemmatimonadales bacterium]
MSLWDDVKGNLGEWYSVTSEKTTELAKISTRRYDKFGISREIERQFSELGNFVYMGLKEDREDLLVDPVALDLVTRIKELEAELLKKTQEIEIIKQEYASRQARSKAAGVDATAGHGSEDSTGDVVETADILITDPVLKDGHSESAILVEPLPDQEETRAD